MSSSTCTFTFDNNPLAVYNSGQLVAGTVELVTVRPKTIRAINITISGFAEVRWIESVNKTDTHGKRMKAVETFSGSEVYYSNTVCVYGHCGGLQVEFLAGKHVFPFQYPLPLNVPTSVSGGWGHVRHEVNLVIDRVMRYNNVFKKAYTVISPQDLNLSPQFREPLYKIDEKSFCWSTCWRNSGPLVLTVRVPFAAYAPGQKIPLHIVVDNQSAVNCSNVKVRLMKRITYTSRSPEVKTKIVESKIADNHCGGVLKVNKAEFMEYLQLPAIPPTSNNYCSILNVSYTLKFIAKTSRLHSDLVIAFPFTIGTVPICDSVLESPQIRSERHKGKEQFSTKSAGAVPAFEEDARCEQFEGDNFKPRYPFYTHSVSQLVLYANNALYPSIPDTTSRTTVGILSAASSTQSTASSAISNVSTNRVLGYSISPDYQPTSNDFTKNNLRT